MFFAYRVFVIAVILVTVVQSSSLYCITHVDSFHNLETCTTSKNRQISAAALASNSISSKNKNVMTFDLICDSDSITCEGVSSTLSEATSIISSVFQFESPVFINASFINFCQEYQDCTDSNRMASVGKAYPYVSYIMVDSSDNMTRMYPQPLLKQFTELKTKPIWSLYDISAQFNSEVDWYFSNNPSPINSNQTDFLRSVLHELIHGLGFLTSWSDDLYTGLLPLFPQGLDRFITPRLLASAKKNELLQGYNTPQPFWGFVEFPFDKYLSYSDDNNLNSFTLVTKQLNQFYDSNVIFRTIIDLANSWYNSNEYGYSKQVYTRSVSQQDVLAVIQGENIATLETSVRPYSTGSSLCHIDLSGYLNSSDYLMVYTANRGIGIAELNKLFPSGPIGPKLKKVMGALGYNIKNAKTIRPTLRYWSPPTGLVGTNSNPNPSLTINLNGPAISPTASASSSNPSVFKSSASSIYLSLTNLILLVITLSNLYF